MDLDEGRAKMRFGGGAAGHKGVLNLIEHCGPDFTRIKIGIGVPPEDFDGDGADWVLEKIDPESDGIFDEIMPKIAEGILRWVLDGTTKATTWFNTELRAPADELSEDSEPLHGDETSEEVTDLPDEQ
jgi:peptidyl-tRNA hydrolase